MLFKCKMCGGDVGFTKGDSVVECEYCGTKQTLPRINDDRILNLYDRANHFRRNNEFDKAMSIYDQILDENPTDSESFWSIVLCKYGIEYVDDPLTKKKVPTVNRTQFTSIYADDDYKSAIKYADASQKVLYEEEAAQIDHILKGILDISKNEDPFDVFICYKETDQEGNRTQDSVLANEIYHELTQQGFKVFFSRITLEDKAGQAYEPYIFAALNSAKVMIAIGTKPEYFNAVWVRNEWSRYLQLIRNGDQKTLIPAYKDMDPYDLPDEFSYLQAFDMGKLGFMQDLIRGIKKILQPDDGDKQGAEVSVGGVSLQSLLNRARLFIEDKDWESAIRYSDRVLDLDTENADAYLLRAMAELQVSKLNELAQCNLSYMENASYCRAKKYATQEEVAELNALEMKCKEYHAKLEQERIRLEQERIENEKRLRIKQATDLNKLYDMKSAAEMNQFLQEAKKINPDVLPEEALKKIEDLSKAERLYGNMKGSAIKALTPHIEKVQKEISGESAQNTGNTDENTVYPFPAPEPKPMTLNDQRNATYSGGSRKQEYEYEIETITLDKTDQSKVLKDSLQFYSRFGWRLHSMEPDTTGGFILIYERKL